ncbi:hypothetical protein A6A27_39595 [Micromonospora sp. CB01531]|nr:hypothetical protein A6A27_39595 [Micromonospora sp. CB01531]
MLFALDGVAEPVGDSAIVWDAVTKNPGVMALVVAQPDGQRAHVFWLVADDRSGVVIARWVDTQVPGAFDRSATAPHTAVSVLGEGGVDWWAQQLSLPTTRVLLLDPGGRPTTIAGLLGRPTASSRYGRLLDALLDPPIGPRQPGVFPGLEAPIGAPPSAEQVLQSWLNVALNSAESQQLFEQHRDVLLSPASMALLEEELTKNPGLLVHAVLLDLAGLNRADIGYRLLQESSPDGRRRVLFGSFTTADPVLLYGLGVLAAATADTPAGEADGIIAQAIVDGWTSGNRAEMPAITERLRKVLPNLPKPQRREWAGQLSRLAERWVKDLPAPPPHKYVDSTDIEPVDPQDAQLVDNLLGMSPDERAQALGSLKPEHRYWLAGNTAFIDGLKDRLSPGEFATAAAWLMVSVDGRTHQPVSAGREARALVAWMLQDADTARRVLTNGVRVVVIPKDVSLTDVGPFRSSKGQIAGGVAGGGRSWDTIRGAGYGRVYAVPEEDLLGGDTTIGDTLRSEDGSSIATHEFAHAIHLHGLSGADQRLILLAFYVNLLDPDADTPDGPRIDFDGNEEIPYAHADDQEFFAQVCNAYLGTNHGTDASTGQSHNNGADWVRATQPLLAPLMATLFGPDPSQVHPAPANPVKATYAEEAMYDGFRNLWDGQAQHKPQADQNPPSDEQVLQSLQVWLNAGIWYSQQLLEQHRGDLLQPVSQSQLEKMIKSEPHRANWLFAHSILLRLAEINRVDLGYRLLQEESVDQRRNMLFHSFAEDDPVLLYCLGVLARLAGSSTSAGKVDGFIAQVAALAWGNQDMSGHIGQLPQLLPALPPQLRREWAEQLTRLAVRHDNHGPLRDLPALLQPALKLDTGHQESLAPAASSPESDVQLVGDASVTTGPEVTFFDNEPQVLSAEAIKRAYPWLGQVNPWRDIGGDWTTNCVLAAIGTDLSLQEDVGHQVPPEKPVGLEFLENYANARFATVANVEAFVAAMWVAPVGARGLVVLSRPGGQLSHVFNAVRHQDGVALLDGQSGTPARVPADVARIQFVALTNGIKITPSTPGSDNNQHVLVGADHEPEPAGQSEAVTGSVDESADEGSSDAGSFAEEDPVGQSLESWLSANNWDESRALLNQRRDVLLSDGSRARLAQMVNDKPGDPQPQLHATLLSLAGSDHADLGYELLQEDSLDGRRRVLFGSFAEDDPVLLYDLACLALATADTPAGIAEAFIAMAAGLAWNNVDLSSLTAQIAWALPQLPPPLRDEWASQLIGLAVWHHDYDQLRNLAALLQPDRERDASSGTPYGPSRSAAEPQPIRGAFTDDDGLAQLASPAPVTNQPVDPAQDPVWGPVQDPELVRESTPLGFRLTSRGPHLVLEQPGWRVPEGVVEVVPLPDRITIAVAAAPDLPANALATAITSMVEMLYPEHPPSLRLLVHGTGSGNQVAQRVLWSLSDPDLDVLAPTGAWSVTPNGELASPDGWLRYIWQGGPVDVTELVGAGQPSGQPRVGPEPVIPMPVDRLAAWVDTILGAAQDDDNGLVRLDMVCRAFYGGDSAVGQDSPWTAFGPWQPAGADQIGDSLRLRGSGSTAYVSGRLPDGRRGYGGVRNENGELFWIDVTRDAGEPRVSPFSGRLPLDDPAAIVVDRTGYRDDVSDGDSSDGEQSIVLNTAEFSEGDAARTPAQLAERRPVGEGPASDAIIEGPFSDTIIHGLAAHTVFLRIVGLPLPSLVIVGPEGSERADYARDELLHWADRYADRLLEYVDEVGAPNPANGWDVGEALRDAITASSTGTNGELRIEWHGARGRWIPQQLRQSLVPALTVADADDPRSPGWWWALDPVRGVEVDLASIGSPDFRRVALAVDPDEPIAFDHVELGTDRDLAGSTPQPPRQTPVQVVRLRLDWQPDGVAPEVVDTVRRRAVQAVAAVNERFLLPGGVQFHLHVVGPGRTAEGGQDVHHVIRVGPSDAGPSGPDGPELLRRLLRLLGVRDVDAVRTGDDGRPLLSPRALAQIWVVARTSPSSGPLDEIGTPSSSSPAGPVGPVGPVGLPEGPGSLESYQAITGSTGKGNRSRSVRPLPNGMWLVPPPPEVRGVEVSVEELAAVVAGMTVPEGAVVVTGYVDHTGGGLAADGEPRAVLRVPDLIDAISGDDALTIGERSEPQRRVLVLYLRGDGQPSEQVSISERVARAVQAEIDDRTILRLPTPHGVVVGRWSAGLFAWYVGTPGVSELFGPRWSLADALDVARGHTPPPIDLDREVRTRLAGGRSHYPDQVLAALVGERAGDHGLGLSAYRRRAAVELTTGTLDRVRVPVRADATVLEQLEAARGCLRWWGLREVAPAVAASVPVQLGAGLAAFVLRLPATDTEPAVSAFVLRAVDIDDPHDPYQRDWDVWVNRYRGADGVVLAAVRIPHDVGRQRLEEVIPGALLGRLVVEPGQLSVDGSQLESAVDGGSLTADAYRDRLAPTPDGRPPVVLLAHPLTTEEAPAFVTGLATSAVVVSRIQEVGPQGPTRTFWRSIGQGLVGRVAYESRHLGHLLTQVAMLDRLVQESGKLSGDGRRLLSDDVWLTADEYRARLAPTPDGRPPVVLLTHSRTADEVPGFVADLATSAVVVWRHDVAPETGNAEPRTRTVWRATGVGIDAQANSVGEVYAWLGEGGGLMGVGDAVRRLRGGRVTGPDDPAELVIRRALVDAPGVVGSSPVRVRVALAGDPSQGGFDDFFTRARLVISLPAEGEPTVEQVDLMVPARFVRQLRVEGAPDTVLDLAALRDWGATPVASQETARTWQFILPAPVATPQEAIRRAMATLPPSVGVPADGGANLAARLLAELRPPTSTPSDGGFDFDTVFSDGSDSTGSGGLDSTGAGRVAAMLGGRFMPATRDELLALGTNSVTLVQARRPRGGFHFLLAVGIESGFYLLELGPEEIVVPESALPEQIWLVAEPAGQLAQLDLSVPNQPWLVAHGAVASAAPPPYIPRPAPPPPYIPRPVSPGQAAVDAAARPTPDLPLFPQPVAGHSRADEPVVAPRQPAPGAGYLAHRWLNQNLPGSAVSIDGLSPFARQRASELAARAVPEQAGIVRQQLADALPGLVIEPTDTLSQDVPPEGTRIWLATPDGQARAAWMCADGRYVVFDPQLGTVAQIPAADFALWVGDQPHTFVVARPADVPAPPEDAPRSSSPRGVSGSGRSAPAGGPPVAPRAAGSPAVAADPRTWTAGDRAVVASGDEPRALPGSPAGGSIQDSAQPRGQLSVASAGPAARSAADRRLPWVPVVRPADGQPRQQGLWWTVREVIVPPLPSWDVLRQLSQNPPGRRPARPAASGQPPASAGSRAAGSLTGTNVLSAVGAAPAVGATTGAGSPPAGRPLAWSSVGRRLSPWAWEQLLAAVRIANDTGPAAGPSIDRLVGWMAVVPRDRDSGYEPGLLDCVPLAWGAFIAMHARTGNRQVSDLLEDPTDLHPLVEALNGTLTQADGAVLLPALQARPGAMALVSVQPPDRESHAFWLLSDAQGVLTLIDPMASTVPQPVTLPNGTRDERVTWLALPNTQVLFLAPDGRPAPPEVWAGPQPQATTSANRTPQQLLDPPATTRHGMYRPHLQGHRAAGSSMTPGTQLTGPAGTASGKAWAAEVLAGDVLSQRSDTLAVVSAVELAAVVRERAWKILAEPGMTPDSGRARLVHRRARLEEFLRVVEPLLVRASAEVCVPLVSTAYGLLTDDGRFTNVSVDDSHLTTTDLSRVLAGLNGELTAVRDVDLNALKTQLRASPGAMVLVSEDPPQQREGLPGPRHTYWLWVDDGRGVRRLDPLQAGSFANVTEDWVGALAAHPGTRIALFDPAERKSSSLDALRRTTVDRTVEALSDPDNVLHRHGATGPEVEGLWIIGLPPAIARVRLGAVLAERPGLALVVDRRGFWETETGRLYHDLSDVPRGIRSRWVVKLIVEVRGRPIATLVGDGGHVTRDSWFNSFGRIKGWLDSAPIWTRDSAESGGNLLSDLSSLGWEIAAIGRRMRIFSPNVRRVDDLYVQYTVGLPLATLYELFGWLLSEDRASIHDRGPLRGGLAFGDIVGGLFLKSATGHEIQKYALELFLHVEEFVALRSFVALTYMQVAAVVSDLFSSEDTLAKNRTPVALRNPLRVVREQLSKDSQTFLGENAEEIAPLFERRYLDWNHRMVRAAAQNKGISEVGDILGLEVRRPETPDFRIKDYLNNALIPSPGVSLSQYEALGVNSSSSDYSQLDTNDGRRPLPLLLSELRAFRGIEVTAEEFRQHFAEIADASEKLHDDAVYLRDLASHYRSGKAMVNQIWHDPLVKAVLPAFDLVLALQGQLSDSPFLSRENLATTIRILGRIPLVAGREESGWQDDLDVIKQNMLTLIGKLRRYRGAPSANFSNSIKEAISRLQDVVQQIEARSRSGPLSPPPPLTSALR